MVVFAACAVAGALLPRTAAASEDANAFYPFAKRESLKILMIGNSFSDSVVHSSTPMGGITRALGKKVFFVSLFKPGCSITTHYKNREKVDTYEVHIPAAQKPDWPKNGQSLATLLQVEKWDLITIHEYSGSSYKNWSEWAAYSNLVTFVHEKAPNAKIYLQQTWSMDRFSGGLSDENKLPSFEKRDAQYELIAAQYKKAVAKFDKTLPGVVCGVIPTGYAVQLYRYRRPVTTFASGKLLMNPSDSKHLAKHGHAMQSLVWTKRIFGTLPPIDKLPGIFKKEVGGEEAATFLWNCANDAVGPDKDVFNYGKGTVDFSFDVTFKKADGTDIEKQRVRFGAKPKAPAGNEGATWRPSMTLPSRFKATTDALSSSAVAETPVFDDVVYTHQ